MWLGSRLTHDSIKRIVDHQSAELMRGTLAASGIPIRTFNVIAESIESSIAQRKEERTYSHRRLSRRMWSKCGRTFFDLIIFLLFCVLGAAVYHFIEYPLEVKTTLEYDETAVILKDLSNLTDVVTGTHDDNPLIKEMSKIAVVENMTHFEAVGDPNTMRERVDYVVAEALEPDAAPSEVGVLRWEVDTALFWSLTVITTIGYGQFNPVTTPGRLFVIPYGFIGILLGGYALLMVAYTITLSLEVCLNRILPVSRIPIRTGKRQYQDTMADVVSRQRVAAWRTLIVSVAFLAVYISGFTVVFWKLAEDEDWGVIEGLYYSFVTITTIGFGDYVPDDKWLFCATVYVCFGLGMFNMFLMATTELVFTGDEEFSDCRLTEPEQNMLDWLHDEIFDEADLAKTTAPSSTTVKPGAGSDYVLLGDKEEALPLIHQRTS